MKKEFRINKRGFTLIELLIVVAIIGILAAAAIPGYLGMQERGKKGTVTRISEASLPELQAWINSAKKGTAALGVGLLPEVDMNGNGTVEAAETNNALATAGIVTTWLLNHNTNKSEQSPWGGGGLWFDGGSTANRAACEAAAAAGQISLCFTPAEDSTIRTIFVVARDTSGSTVGTVAGGKVLFSKAVSAD